MIRRFIFVSAVCTLACATLVGCDDSSNPTDPGSSASPVGVYKSNSTTNSYYSMGMAIIDSILIDIRSNNNCISSFYYGVNVEADTSAYTYSSSNSRVTLDDGSFFTLNGNTLTDMYSYTFTKK